MKLQNTPLILLTTLLMLYSAGNARAVVNSLGARAEILTHSTDSSGAALTALAEAEWAGTDSLDTETANALNALANIGLFAPLLSAAPPDPLDPPIGVDATDNAFDDRIVIIWDAAPEATHYRVFRTLDRGLSPLPITAWMTETTLDDLAAEPGETYHYSIRAAVSATGERQSALSASDSGWYESLSPGWTGFSTWQVVEVDGGDYSGVYYWNYDIDAWVWVEDLGGVYPVPFFAPYKDWVSLFLYNFQAGGWTERASHLRMSW